MDTPRVRFAPSPTGFLHVGGARTALFNWLYARRHGGVFVLRVEDTDQARSTEESRQAIFDAMTWLGLDWDEGPGVGGSYGPYLQMERLDIYREYADRLVEEGKAYRCYATAEELKTMRDAAQKAGKQFVYPHLWRNKTKADWPSDEKYVIRFKTPLDGETSFDDLVFGKITTPNHTIQDFVIQRSDGIPLYNFGVVLDDVLMKINLVARGADHIINTAPQVLLYQAMNYAVPKLAHLPMLLAPNGEKLSKRNADKYSIPIGVLQYRDLGYSPTALLNYLVRFGWGHGDQEIFSRDEMIQLFDFEGINKKDGKYDIRKCIDVNHKHLNDEKLMPTDDYVKSVVPFLKQRGLEEPAREKLEAAIATIRPRGKTFAEAADGMDFYFRDNVQWDEKAKAKFLKPEAASNLRGMADVLEGCDPFEVAEMEALVNAWLEEKSLSIKQVAQPARVAVTGRSASPGLYEVMVILGKAETLKRLRDAASLAEVG
jgi:glutamyl-tRNA synthetase